MQNIYCNGSTTSVRVTELTKYNLRVYSIRAAMNFFSRWPERQVTNMSGLIYPFLYDNKDVHPETVLLCDRTFPPGIRLNEGLHELVRRKVDTSHLNRKKCSLLSQFCDKGCLLKSSLMSEAFWHGKHHLSYKSFCFL